MTKFASTHSKAEKLETDLKFQHEPAKRIETINELIGIYSYTNIHKTKEYLPQQYALLKRVKDPQLELEYHLHAAFIENQYYQFPIAEHHFKKAIGLLEEIGDLKKQAELYIDYAGICINLEKLKDATAYLEKSAQYLKRYPDKILQGRHTCREGYINIAYANYSRATEQFLEADKEINTAQERSLKDYYFLSLIQSGIGNCHEHSSNDLENAVKNYLKALEVCHEHGLDTRLSWHYLNVGKAFIGMTDIDKAEHYFRRAIQINDMVSDDARAGAYANLGYCFFLRDRFDEALDCFEQGERLYRQNPETNYSNFVTIENWRAELHAALGNREEAEQHFIKAFEYANKKADGKQFSEICKRISKFYADRGDYKNAYEYQLLHENVNEKNAEKFNSRKILELEVKYESEKRRQESEMLRLQAKSLQLKALRAQMNPHFMYNALNSIQNYITSNEIKDASRYLAKFARLMRQSLDYSDLEVISLEKEIQFLDDYLGINEKLRFKDKLRYQITVDPEIEQDILGVPTMLIQPYVENSIEHGLRNRKTGIVRIDFKLIDDYTVLCIVEDNGIGRHKARELQEVDEDYRKHESKGTKITEERLLVLHNSKVKQHFIETVDLTDNFSGEPMGTMVKIKIPIVEIHSK